MLSRLEIGRLVVNPFGVVRVFSDEEDEEKDKTPEEQDQEEEEGDSQAHSRESGLCLSAGVGLFFEIDGRIKTDDES